MVGGPGRIHFLKGLIADCSLDLTENLVGKEWEDAEADLFMAFSKNTDESMFNNKDDDAVRVSVALRNVIHSTNICTGLVDSSKESAWREAFMQAVCEVLVGFREERPLLDGNRISMFSWMRLRAITISGMHPGFLVYLYFVFLIFK